MTEGTFKQMTGENPDLLNLIKDFDLRDPRTGLPYGTGGTSEVDRLKLSKIAQRVLNRGRIYTSEQIVSLLSETLKISRQRAVNGLRMMLTSGVLTASTGTGIRLTM